MIPVQLFDSNQQPVVFCHLNQTQQPQKPLVIFIKNSEGLPIQSHEYIIVGPGQDRRMRIKIYLRTIPQRKIIPSGDNVGYFFGVANGLDGVDIDRIPRSENRHCSLTEEEASVAGDREGLVFLYVVNYQGF